MKFDRIRKIYLTRMTRKGRKKKKHNREFIPGALDIIRLIFRMEIKAVVRGCGVGAADSFCIIHQIVKFVNS